MKKLFSWALIAFSSLMFAGAAFAADTIKGINQNNKQEVVPVEPIASVKYSGGVLYYRHQFSATEYSLTDANASQYNKVLTAWTGNSVQNAATGYVYNLHKVRITCQPSSGSQITALGQFETETLSDGCQLWQTANGL